MKHKHYDLIIAWATGIEIQWFDAIKMVWVDFSVGRFYPNTQYRIKPTPLPQWQQDLIDAAKAGKVVEIKGIDEWVSSSVNTYFAKNDFGDTKKDRYRIRPTKVTRYLWAYKGSSGNWRETCVFKTEQEAEKEYEDIEHVRLDYTATEFEE